MEDREAGVTGRWTVHPTHYPDTWLAAAFGGLLWCRQCDLPIADGRTALPAGELPCSKPRPLIVVTGV